MAIETPTMVVTCDFCPETIEIDLTDNYAVSGPVTLFDSTASERELADDGWALHFGPADEVRCDSCVAGALDDDEESDD